MLDYDILHFSWDNHKFLVSFNRVYDMNIPKHYWNITNFRATLGHKINHSFKDSKAKFGIAFHPRFGKVVTIIATKNITKHEEILIDYGYARVNNAPVPEWYSGLYLKEFGENWYRSGNRKSTMDHLAKCLKKSK